MTEATPIFLTSEERAELEVLARYGKTEHRKRLKAQIVLMAAAGVWNLIANGIGSITALGDEPLVRIVIRNLVSNGIKFSRNGGVVQLSALAAQSDDGGPMVRITVRDDGEVEDVEVQRSRNDNASRVAVASMRRSGCGVPGSASRHTRSFRVPTLKLMRTGACAASSASMVETIGVVKSTTAWA